MKLKVLVLTCLTLLGCDNLFITNKSEIKATSQSNNLKFEVIFKEGFETTPDWVSTSKNSNGDLRYPITNNAPINWDHVRSDPKWSPSTGHDDRFEPVNIKEHDPMMVRTGKKSAVFARDSSHSPFSKWMSDGYIGKTFDKDYKQIYMEFYIRFTPDSAKYRSDFSKPNEEYSNIGKIARILAWDRVGSFSQNFSKSVNKPTAGYCYGLNAYGQRNHLFLRGHPPTGDKDENNYYFTPYKIKGLPRNMNVGNLPLNYVKDIRDLNGDGKVDNDITTFLSATDGKPIGHLGGTVTHKEMWGDRTTSPIWRKLAFFVKMNSKPGVMDGVYKMWIDDNLIFSVETIPWIGHASPIMKGWNSIKLGGNDYIKGKLKQESPDDPPVYLIPDSIRYQEWYAIDDIMVATDIPPSLQEDK